MQTVIIWAPGVCHALAEETRHQHGIFGELVEGVGLGDMEGPACRASPLELVPVGGGWWTLKICHRVEGKEVAVEFSSVFSLLYLLSFVSIALCSYHIPGGY